MSRTGYNGRETRDGADDVTRTEIKIIETAPSGHRDAAGLIPGASPDAARLYVTANNQTEPSDGFFLYKQTGPEAYNASVDVAVSELRAHLSDYLDRAQAGDEVVITDRGVPIARLLGLTAAATLERLAADGIIGRAAASPRPTASGRSRTRPRRPVADQVSDQRR